MKLKFSAVTTVVVMLFAGLTGAASASAHEFVISSPPTTLSITSTGAAQEFETAVGNFECQKLSGSGSAESERVAALDLQLHYTNCKLFGYKVDGGIEADYEFSANGTVKLAKEIVIKTEAACTVHIPGGQTLALTDSKEQSEGELGYTDVDGKIEAKLNTEGIESQGVGAECAYSEVGSGRGHGTYLGKFLVTPGSGTIAWQ